MKNWEVKLTETLCKAIKQSKYDFIAGIKNQQDKMVRAIKELDQDEIVEIANHIIEYKFEQYHIYHDFFDIDDQYLEDPEKIIEQYLPDPWKYYNYESIVTNVKNRGFPENIDDWELFYYLVDQERRFIENSLSEKFGRHIDLYTYGRSGGYIGFSIEDLGTMQPEFNKDFTENFRESLIDLVRKHPELEGFETYNVIDGQRVVTYFEFLPEGSSGKYVNQWQSYLMNEWDDNRHIEFNSDWIQLDQETDEILTTATELIEKSIADLEAMDLKDQE